MFDEAHHPCQDPPKDDIRGGGLHAFEERLKQYTRLEKRLSKTRPEELTVRSHSGIPFC